MIYQAHRNQMWVVGKALYLTEARFPPPEIVSKISKAGTGTKEDDKIKSFLGIESEIETFRGRGVKNFMHKKNYMARKCNLA